VSSRGLLRKVRRLEREIVGDLEDDVLDVVMWSGSGGGVFGHVHYRFSKSLMEQESAPCSDEEEVEIMRQHYENGGHGCRGTEVPFWKYLEAFSYLAPDGLAERQRAVIDKLRGEENGERVADSAH
jgi:hypothetical protein